MVSGLESSLNSLDYFNVQNISFDHPLTTSEIEEFRAIVFSINNLLQVYFKGDIDIDSIEAIKNLLSISGFVDDRIIEKCIAVKFPREDIDRLLAAKYENPETWKLCYDVEDKNYMLSDIPKCRSFFSFIDRIKLLTEKEELTQFEKVLRIYDIVKMFDYSSADMSDKSSLLPDIVVEEEASSLGYNKLFSYILRELGINSFVGKVKSGDGKESYSSIVQIEDEKYGINGIYLFDPSMDTLPRDTYKNDDIRMINYNYFGIMLKDMENSIYGDSLSGALSIAAIEDFDYSSEKRNTSKDTQVKKEFATIDSVFGLPYEKFHSKVNKSKPITFEDISSAIDNVYGKNKTVPNYMDVVKENYFSRKDQLFKPTVNELLDQMLK